MNSFLNPLRLIFNYLTKGYDFSHDDSRRRFMFRLLIYCACFFLGSLGIFAYIEGENILGLIDFFAIALLLSILILMDRILPLNWAIGISCWLYLASLYYLYVSGSARNQSFLWYYSVPVVFNFLMGRKKGLAMSLILWSLSLLTYLLRARLPFFTTYPDGFVMRILSSHLLLIILMYIYEYSRELTSRKLVITNKELREKAIRDGLTGLYNRRYMDEIWAILNRQPGKNDKCLAFIMLDIDYFKLYNDTYGHQKGDDVLIEIARTLKGLIRRESDHIFRYGGEEFAVLLYGTTSEKAVEKTQDIIQKVAELNIPHNQSPLGKVTVSAGCQIQSFSQTIEGDVIILKADKCLYEAKRQGKNRSIICREP
ncbi:MAG: GGDEF domain-containing protein [Spirochaetales bacterium]|nr:GGDEF domain-containing protein [Spirochaetales bacterium]